MCALYLLVVLLSCLSETFAPPSPPPPHRWMPPLRWGTVCQDSVGWRCIWSGWGTEWPLQSCWSRPAEKTSTVGVSHVTQFLLFITLSHNVCSRLQYNTLALYVLLPPHHTPYTSLIVYIVLHIVCCCYCPVLFIPHISAYLVESNDAIGAGRRLPGQRVGKWTCIGLPHSQLPHLWRH